MIQIVLCANVHSQDCYIRFLGEPTDVTAFKKMFSKDLTCDTTSNQRFLSGAMTRLHQKGYLLASYSMTGRKDTVETYVYLGERFSWAYLNTTDVPDQILRRAGFKSKDFQSRSFDQQRIKRLFRGLITESENGGLPFSSTYLDSIHFSDEGIAAKLIYDPGPRITFDSLKFQQNLKIKKKWLASYLHIEEGAAFSQKKVAAIESKINQLGFIVLNAAPGITFQNKQAIVELDLITRKTSRVDGILGFLPNEEEEGKLLVTGQFDLSLRNLFSSGKGLDIEWQSLKARSQLLDIIYSHPNLFSSALNFDGSFNLLKEDTIFTTRQGELNFTFKPSKHSFTVFSQFRSSNLLSTTDFQDINNLPDLSDFSVDYYGLKYQFNTLNDAFLPTSGVSGFLNAGVGSKRIRINADLPEELYSNVDLNSVQYLVETGFKSYWRWSNHLVFHYNLSAAKVINDRLFLNDLFRVGGLTSLRGFNENFFFASDYVLSTAEFQFYFQSDSYFFAFYDQSYLYYNIENSLFEDYPMGIGLGLNLATSSGLVSLAYGLGKAENQPLSLSLSKFHFGYIAKF